MWKYGMADKLCCGNSKETMLETQNTSTSYWKKLTGRTFSSDSGVIWNSSGESGSGSLNYKQNNSVRQHLPHFPF
jgi:hypothetical protein